MYQNPLQDPIIQKFSQLLERLTKNDSRIIQCLSKIAEDYQNTTEYTQIFTSQLMGSIFQSESQRKVNYLYVLDSILKVVGGPYIELFSPFLGEIFVHVYQFSTPQSQRQMHTIFETWKVIIPNNFLEKIPKQIIFPPLDQEQASKIEFFKQLIKNKQSNKSPTLSPAHQEAQNTQIQQQEVQSIQTDSNLNQDSKNSEILAFIKQTPFAQLPDVLLQNLINSNNILEELLQTQQTEFLVFAELARRFRGKIEKSNLESRQSFNVEINQLETRYEEVIKRLYEEIPFRCAVCGLRFESHGLLTKHLDDHFEQKKEDRITQQWMPNASQWTNVASFNAQTSGDFQTQFNQYRAKADINQKQCLVCGQDFKTESSNNGWIYLDALWVHIEENDSNCILHVECFNQVEKSNEEEQIELQLQQNQQQNQMEEEYFDKFDLTLNQ